MNLHKPYSTYKSSDTNNEIQCIIQVDEGLNFVSAQIQGNNCVFEYRLDGIALSTPTQKLLTHAIVPAVSSYTFKIRNAAGTVIGSSVVRTNLPFNTIDFQPYLWLQQVSGGYTVHFTTMPLNGNVRILPNTTIVNGSSGVRVIFNDQNNPITTGTVLPPATRLEGSCSLTPGQGPDINVFIPFDGEGTTTQGDAE